MNLQVLPLTAADIPRAMEFVSAAGWNQTAATWSRFIGFQPHGCFKAVSNSGMIGTVTSTCYGQTLAWIGMMLVAPESRRQGVGRALMLHVVEYLQSQGMQTIKLDATPMGRPLYEGLGFTAQYDFYRWRRDAVDVPATTIASCNFEQLSPQLRTLDTEAFGMGRIEWLSQAAVDGQVLITERGFGMLRPGRLNDYLGPITAQSFAAAQPIIETLCRATSAPIIWDIPKEDQGAYSLATELGFSQLRPLSRMVLGADQTCPKLELQWGICDPASG